MIILFPGSWWSKDNAEHDNEHEHTDFSKHVDPDNRILKSNIWDLHKAKDPANKLIISSIKATTTSFFKWTWNNFQN